MDISAALGWGERSTGRIYREGSDQEEAVDALAAIATIDGGFYFIMVDESIPTRTTGLTADRQPAISNWASATRRFYSQDSIGNAATVQNEAASAAAIVSALENERQAITWQPTRLYSGVSAAGIFSGVNWRGKETVPTAKFRTLNGVPGSNLSAEQAAELDRKRINYYTSFDGSAPIYTEGVTTKPGVYMDTRIWLDWLVNALETEILNLLRSVPRVGQTTNGLARLHATIQDVLEQGAGNGGIAPGTVSAALQDDIRQSRNLDEFNGELPNGYLIHIGSLATQPQSDRDARIAPPIKIWLKSAGAIHSVSIDIQFEN